MPCCICEDCRDSSSRVGDAIGNFTYSAGGARRAAGFAQSATSNNYIYKPNCISSLRYSLHETLGTADARSNRAPNMPRMP